MSDSFQAPRADTAPPDVDVEEPPRFGIVPTLAAIGIGICGFMGLAYALQLMVFIRFYGWSWIGPPVILGLSAVALLLAALLTLARPWTAWAAASVAALQLLVALTWNVYAITQTLFSPLGILWMLACFPPVLLVPLSIARIHEIAEYRRRLMLDLDQPAG